MTSTTAHQTTIEAPKDVPTIVMVRDFDAPRDRVLRAWTDPELVARWMGPRSTEMRILQWDCRTGGSYRYEAWREGERIAGFWGSFHDVQDDRVVQTFSFDGMPDAIALETMWFEDLGDGMTRLHAQSLCDSIEGRDGMLSSGMDTGVHEGYAKLDALLADGAV